MPSRQIMCREIYNGARTPKTAIVKAYGPTLQIFSGTSQFLIYPPGLPNRIKISRILQKKKGKLIHIPQYLIMFCNNFPEETKVKRGDSYCVIFFTFKRRRHSTTQVWLFI